MKVRIKHAKRGNDWVYKVQLKAWGLWWTTDFYYTEYSARRGLSRLEKSILDGRKADDKEEFVLFTKEV